MIRRLKKKLEEQGILYREQVPTATLCTFQIGGIATLVVTPQCEKELVDTVSLCQGLGIPFVLIGRGSNLLFEDGRITAVLIRTTALDAVRLTRNGIYASCGVFLPRLCLVAAREGLGGLEFACGIPGTLGGALTMNAGAHGSAISDVVKSVRLLDLCDGKIKTDFHFKQNTSYRNCGYKPDSVLFLSAELELEPGTDTGMILAQMRAYSTTRRAAQPLSFPSAGCVFRRPDPHIPIGKLLEETGCKGMAVGGASVSEKHAAFIVNNGGASANDVEILIQKIQKKVQKERGIFLKPEIRIIPSEE